MGPSAPLTTTTVAPAWLALVLACALGGCRASQAQLPPGDEAPLAPAFVTAVIAFNEGTGDEQCGDETPACDELGTCGPVDVLGAPDEVAYDLPADGFIEVAFLCNSMIERGGGASPELKLHATVPDGTTAVLQVSIDGLTFDELGVVDAATLEFDLARLELTDARYIRLLNQGPGALAIDAFEALRNP